MYIFGVYIGVYIESLDTPPKWFIYLLWFILYRIFLSMKIEEDNIWIII